MSSSGELTTERIGRLRSPMSATVLAHDDDVRLFDPMGDRPYLMLILLAFIVIVSLIFFYLAL